MPSSDTHASIVIVCFGRRDVTERCLESLDHCLGGSLGREIELVLVDNASPDDTLELLDRWRDRARVLELAENRNFSGGCNAGAQAATGDALVFLNNDTVMEPGVIEALAATVAEPGVGAAGPRLLFPDGGIQHAGVIAVPAQGGMIGAFHALLHEDGDLPAGRGVFDLDCVTGACLAVDRTVFERIGGFDEAYRNGYEDVDLCYRVRMDGQRIVYRGDLSLVHEEGATRGSAPADDANHARFLSTWGRHLDPDHDLADAVWGARVLEGIPQRDLPAPSLMLVGQPRGTGSAADETRALLVAAAAIGLPCGALELPPSYVVPELTGATAEAVALAIRAALPQGPALQITVPGGARRLHRIPVGTWVRTAGAAAPAHDGRHVLPAVPVADRPWLPPAVELSPATGAGGAGLLVSLPTHDPAASREIIDALRLAAPRDVRIVPTVRQQQVLSELGERLPGAEVLRPCSHDTAWRALAADADAVVCMDPSDVFERRALVGASEGAVPVLRSLSGPAGAVLSAPVSAGELGLAHAIGAALERSGGRAACAAPVRAQCAPAVVGTRLVDILNGAAEAAAA